MKLFLSYASAYHELAEDLCCRLQAVGHEVFFDREDLPAGTSYDDRIRRAVESAELFIFLISPEAVRQGHYTRTELKLAARKWPTADWHVLPVLVAETPLADVPAYLRALTLMRAEGNLAAEVVIEVEDRVRQWGEGATTEPPRPAQATLPATVPVRYRSLQLRFSADAAGGYDLSLGDGGGARAAGIALDAEALAQGLWRDARDAGAPVRRAVPPIAPSLLPSEASARRIGEALYRALAGSDAGRDLEQGLRTVDPQRGDGLRFVVDTTAAPDLARLPWELLYSPIREDFLFCDRLTPLVRRLEVDAPPPTLAVAPPLRMLMAVAAPSGQPQLAIGDELAHLDSALADLRDDGRLVIRRLDHASLERLDDALLAYRPHVLHFIGHGDFVDGEGVLLLEADGGPAPAAPIAGRRLAVLLRNYRDSLRLVFLNSCFGATAAGNPFGGVAQSLIRRGIPAVIAMQFAIPDRVAVALARHFYRYLAAGQPVDAALSSARAFLYARGHGVEWGAPALHMQSPDGRLFEFGPSPPPERSPVDLPRDAASPTPPPHTETVRRSASKSRPWLLVGVVALAIGAGLWLALPLSPSHRVEPAGTNSGASVDGQTATTPPPPPPPAKDTPGSTDGTISVPSWPGGGIMGSAGSYSDRPMMVPGDASGSASGVGGGANKGEPVGAPSQPALVLTPPMLGELVGGLEREHSELLLSLLEAQIAEFPDAFARARIGPLRERLVDTLRHRQRLAAENGAGERAARYRTLLETFDALPGAVPVEPVILAGEPDPAAGGIDDDGFYIVHRGDTLWSIARRLLGDGAAWPRLLRRHNARVSVGLGGRLVTDPDRIRPGQRIHLPPPSDEAGTAVAYHVVAGDSLSAIAWRMLGDAARWPEILADNRDRVASPGTIRPGQVLHIRLR